MSSMKTGDVVEIDCGDDADEITFLDSAHVLTTGRILRRWRTSDGRQVGQEKEAASKITCIATSNDGQWIVTVRGSGLVTVWDGETLEMFNEMMYQGAVSGVDISPDGTVVATASFDKTVRVWDIRTGLLLLTMKHDETVWQVKFSPDGSRIASGEDGGVLRVFDSANGSLLAKIEKTKGVGPPNGFTIAWSSDGRRLLAGRVGGKITCLDTVTWSVLSELPHHLRLMTGERFCVCYHYGFITLHDVSTLTQIAALDTSKPPLRLTSANSSGIQPKIVYDCSLSPDGRSIAVLWRGGHNDPRVIVIYPLEHILPRFYFVAANTTQGNALHIATDSHPQDPNLAAPPAVPTLLLLQVSPAAFAPWIKDDLLGAKAALTKEITNSHSPSHFLFAQRALVHARMEDWQAAQDDTKKSLDSQRSVVGLIAKSIALTGLKKYKQASRVFDLALADARCDENEKNLLLLIKSVLSWMAGDYDDAIARVTDAMDIARDASPYLFVQAQMYLGLGQKFKDDGDYSRAIESLELARVPTAFEASPELQVVSLIFGWRFEDLRSVIQHLFRETLLDVQPQHDIVRSLLLDETFPAELERSADATQWIDAFTKHRVVVLEQIADKAVTSNEREEAISLYMAALSLRPPVDHNLTMKWAKLKLAKGSSTWESALTTTTEFYVDRLEVYRAVCDALMGVKRWIEASDCLHQVESKFEGIQTNAWYRAYERWIRGMLWRQASASTLARSHDEIIQLCSAALSHRPTNRKYILAKRSWTLALTQKWNDALCDADEVISLDPESHLGYYIQHTALLGTKRYDEALEAYKTMLSKLSASPDKWMAEPDGQYINPSDVEATIREAVERVVRDLPRVLIDTNTGRLRNKSEQISAFFVTTTYKELRASMLTKIEHGRIENAVKAFYRYVMFSHTWEGQEPTFQLVERISVYELQKTPQNEKLIEFCLIALAAGFIWAWSDTCCIDQKDQVVLQESLVSMFRWYYCSAWTVVFLRGDGSLEASRWITRVWTNQEYVAAKKIWFYMGTTGKWKPYLGLATTINDNHKDNPKIREAMVSSVKEAAARKPFADGLQPGLDYIREKLCVASTRNTTLPEDFAYSLLGIFGVSIPVIYGEGESSALGRLLGHLLTASGDASILAWTGESGTFHSCFPTRITVFQTLATTHLPAPLSDTEMVPVVNSLRSSINDTLAVKLYDQLSQLPVPSFSANRMRLPCIMFPLGPLAVIQTRSGRLYRADTAALGEVDIQTNSKLRQLGSLHLVHPWLNCPFLNKELLENGGPVDYVLKLPTARDDELLVTDNEDGDGSSSLLPSTSSAPASTPAVASTLDALTRAFYVLARLKQPFGALLLALTDRGYQRVAADALIKVKLREDVDLNKLIDGVRTIDVV